MKLRIHISRLSPNDADGLLRDFTRHGANGKIGYYSEYNHEQPTIMIACRGATCGSINVSEPKSYINGNAMCLDDVDESIDLTYLEYALRARDFSDVITGSAQPQITATNLEKVEIPIPEKTVQAAFAAFVQQSDKSKFVVSNRNLSRCLEAKKEAED